MSEIVTDAEMRRQVEHVLGDVVAHFDSVGIVADLIEQFGRCDVASIPSGPFWDTVRAWEVSDSR